MTAITHRSGACSEGGATALWEAMLLGGGKEGGGKHERVIRRVTAKAQSKAAAAVVESL